MIELLDAVATIVLYLLIEASNWIFLAGFIFGIVEVVGMLAFWPWVYRIGLRVAADPQQHLQLPGLVAGERSGDTRFAAYRVLSSGVCLFRRRRGFLNTILEWKGTLVLRGSQLEAVALVPLGPVLCAAACLVGWSAYGLTLVLAGEYGAGTIVCAIAVAVVGLGGRESARTGRLRFQRYRDEVTASLASVA